MKNRLSVFLDLLGSGLIDAVSIDVEKSDQIIRLLDAAVIKLEGGTDFDLKALDENFDEDKSKQPELSLFSVDVEKPAKDEVNFPSTKEENGEKAAEKEEGEEKGSDIEEKKVDDNEQEDGEESKDSIKNEDVPAKTEDEDSVIEEPKKEEERNVDSAEDGETSMDANGKEPKQEQQDQKEEEEEIKQEKDEEAPEEAKVEIPQEEGPPRPRALHKTASIFLRNLAPSITKQEVESVSEYDLGFFSD